MTLFAADTESTMRCPTCNAEQAWSNECRRCKCDLTLLRGARLVCRRARAQCLQHLCDGQFASALRSARQYHKFEASADAAKLVAVCHLLAGDYAAAYRFVVRRRL